MSRRSPRAWAAGIGDGHVRVWRICHHVAPPGFRDNVAGNGLDPHMMAVPQLLRRRFQTFGKDRAALKANTMLVRAQAAREGLGLTLLLDDLAARISGHERVWPDAIVSYPVRLVAHPDLRLMARIRTMIDAIAAAFKVRAFGRADASPAFADR